MDRNRRPLPSTNGRGQYLPVSGNVSPVPPYDNRLSPQPPPRFSSNANLQPPYGSARRGVTSPAPPPPAPSYSPTPPTYVPPSPSLIGSTLAPSTLAPSSLAYARSNVSNEGSHLLNFEAALARARGEEPPPVVNTQTPPPHPPVPMPATGVRYAQPSPSYLPPPDPNHPDMSIGFTPSNTIRYALQSFDREPSRSPSPGFDDSINYGAPHAGVTSLDVEKALLAENDRDLGYPSYDRPPSFPDHGDMGLYARGDRSSTYKAPLDGNDANHAGFEPVSLTDQDEFGPGFERHHFGPAPEGRVGRRNNNRVKQRVQLDDTGNFSVELAIPTRLAQFLPVKGVEEHTKMRYTAIMTDPDEFATSGTRLRQNLYNRQTEIFIVVTMYNEDAQLFCRTMYGLMRNIAQLCARKNSRVWGHNGWQKVVICIVADGRTNVNPRVLDCLAALGVFQAGALTSTVKDKPVKAHLFEYTTSFALNDDLQFRYPDKGVVPCQIMFCIKEKNAKKINSHRWFFNAFAPLLEPNVCILIDVGTKPQPKSIYHLWKAFDVNSNVGGACGEIATFKGKNWRGLLNPLVASQCFEYKMSNILDKPMESVFGYISVLPGAFSAYRYIALKNDANGRGPLASYFQGENLHSSGADTFTANMYLAEDRILCFEIVAKPNSGWVLKYVKSAVGETDCPESIPEFIGQRRRWLNGSFFAAVYALIHFRQVWASGHTAIRKSMLMVEFVYNALNLMFGWFSLANYYIFFVILTSSLEGKAFHIKNIWILNRILQYIYLGAVVACFIFGLGNRPQGAPWKYKITIYIFAALTTYMMICAGLSIGKAIEFFDAPIFARMVVSLIATYGIYIVASLLALDPWHMFTCFIQYILFSPTYINVLNIYAYSNLHDLSWGTKGSDTVDEGLAKAEVIGGSKEAEVELVSAQHDIDNAYQDALDNLRLKQARVDASEMPPKPGDKEQRQKDAYANFRTNLLLVWSLSNALLASIILSPSSTEDTFSSGGGNTIAGVYMMVILVFVALMAGFRFICALTYLIIRLFGG